MRLPLWECLSFVGVFLPCALAFCFVGICLLKVICNSMPINSTIYAVFAMAKLWILIGLRIKNWNLLIVFQICGLCFYSGFTFSLDVLNKKREITQLYYDL